MSQILELIRNQNFSYLHPIFYRNKNVLRCELSKTHHGMADRNEAYKHAMEIFDILFPHGADALFFHFTVTDASLCEDYNFSKQEIKYMSEYMHEQMHFLFSFPANKREVIEHLDIDREYAPPEIIKRNRIIYFANDDKTGLNEKALIKRLTSPKEGRLQNFEPSFVSFDNECIFTIYDERGCDIFFADKEKYNIFYQKLASNLFDYDLERMLLNYQDNA